MQRYSTITEKNPREIVLLRGRGCRYRRCAFCDYHEDASCDEAANLAINTEALENVTGQYGTLEIVNSGSFCELEESTMKAIIGVCVAKGIRIVHFESKSDRPSSEIYIPNTRRTSEWTYYCTTPISA